MGAPRMDAIDVTNSGNPTRTEEATTAMSPTVHHNGMMITGIKAIGSNADRLTIETIAEIRLVILRGTDRLRNPANHGR